MDETVAGWRHSEGEKVRASKGRERDPDPDWSMPELCRDLQVLVREFFDFRREHGEGSLRVAFEAWASSRWEAPLSAGAAGLVMGAVRQAVRHAEGADPTLGASVPPRRREEATEAYLERLARLNGWLAPDQRGGARAMPEADVGDARLPYKDPEDQDDGFRVDPDPQSDEPGARDE